MPCPLLSDIEVINFALQSTGTSQFSGLLSRAAVPAGKSIDFRRVWGCFVLLPNPRKCQPSSHKLWEMLADLLVLELMQFRVVNRFPSLPD
jgi:hypothetical protein